MSNWTAYLHLHECYMRAFGDEPHNFEPWCQEKRMTLELTSLSPNFHTTPMRGRLSPDSFNVQQLLYIVGLQRHNEFN
ncbi:hypothetical protein TNCV_4053951 [Trichonephila clavipes]|nr:hypothetical protein TNCV_4053951 [Trichonephila clavipes]